MTEKTLQQILATLTPEELRWVDYRLQSRSDAEATRRLGLNDDAVYQWVNLEKMRRCVQLAMRARFEFHQERLNALTGKAIDVLERELDNAHPRGHRYDAALAVLDRTLGKPVERMQVESQGLSKLAELMESVQRQMAEAQDTLEAPSWTIDYGVEEDPPAPPESPDL